MFFYVSSFSSFQDFEIVSVQSNQLNIIQVPLFFPSELSILSKWYFQDCLLSEYFIDEWSNSVHILFYNVNSVILRSLIFWKTIPRMYSKVVALLQFNLSRTKNTSLTFAVSFTWVYFTPSFLIQFSSFLWWSLSSMSTRLTITSISPFHLGSPIHVEFRQYL